MDVLNSSQFPQFMCYLLDVTCPAVKSLFFESFYIFLNVNRHSDTKHTEISGVDTQLFHCARVYKYVIF